MLKFKTNIKCGGCIKAVGPFLDGLKEVTKWEVDLSSPDRILTVEGTTDVGKVVQAVKAAGYLAEKIN
jgi:copper chaperone CopZ